MIQVDFEISREIIIDKSKSPYINDGKRKTRSLSPIPKKKEYFP